MDVAKGSLAIVHPDRDIDIYICVYIYILCVYIYNKIYIYIHSELTLPYFHSRCVAILYPKHCMKAFSWHNCLRLKASQNHIYNTRKRKTLLGRTRNLSLAYMCNSFSGRLGCSNQGCLIKNLWNNPTPFSRTLCPHNYFTRTVSLSSFKCCSKKNTENVGFLLRRLWGESCLQEFQRSTDATAQR